MINKMLRKFDARRIFFGIRSSVRSNWLLYVIVFAYIIVMSSVTILKEYTFLTSGFDLGIFNQAFSTTLFDHKLFYETGDLSFNPGGSFFGVHFSPILFLLLPFYAIYPSAENLLVMQTVILALGAFPIYWMARDKIGKRVGAALSIVYFLYPPFFLLNLNDFHLEAFTSTFFLFSVYYLQQEKWTKFSAFMILAMLTIEFAPIIGVFVALYGLLLYSKNRFRDRSAARKYIVLTVFVAVTIFVIGYETKQFFNTNTSPLPSPFHYVLSDPTATVSVIFNDGAWKMLYLITLLAPLAFLPLLAPETLIMALPWIFFGFSSTYTFYYSVYFQYTGFVIPFVVLALPEAIKRLKPQNTRKVLALILLCTTILALYLPYGQGSPWNYQLPATTKRTESIEKVLPLIPPNASVLTENDIFPHVSNRAEAYMYVPKNSTNFSVDYILVDTNSEWYLWQQPDVFGTRIPPVAYTEDATNKGTFRALASIGSILLLKKGYIGAPVLFEPYVFNYKNLILDSGSVREDPSSTTGRVLFHSIADTERKFWHGPYVRLEPGVYNATFVVKVDDPSKLNQGNHLLTFDVTNSSGTVLLAKDYVYDMRVPTKGGWFNVTLTFGIPAPAEEVEFRGYTVASANFSLDYVAVAQLSSQRVSITENAFNGWDLNVNKTICNFTDGVIIHLVNSVGSGPCWNGPSNPEASLLKGNYTARFWLRLDKSYDGPLIDINVTKKKDNATVLLGSLTVYGADFKHTSTWQSFEVNFALSEDSHGLEFSGVDVRQSAPVSFLFVEVYTDTEIGG